MHQLPGRPDSFFTGAKTPACALLSRRQVLSLGATVLAAGLMLASGATAAAGFPERAVTVVVPYSPAGGVDIVTRLVTTPMAEFLGQSIVVENKPGGGTNIGMATVARSAPNGYSLLTASNTLTTNKALYSKLSFDPATDLIPVGRIGEAPLVVVVNAKSPYKSLAELIAAGKAKPGALSYGTAGVGSSGHMASALLEKAGQFKGVHIPYKGGSTAVTDLLGRYENAKFINVKDDPIAVLTEIAQCRCILSSSLHGLIAADSFHIPNLHIVFSDRPLGDGYKFDDYYSAYDVQHRPWDLRVNAAPTLSEAADGWRIRPEQVEEKKRQMRTAFPYPARNGDNA